MLAVAALLCRVALCLDVSQPEEMLHCTLISLYGADQLIVETPCDEKENDQ